MSKTEITDWITAYAPRRGGDVVLAVDNIATISDHDPWVVWLDGDGKRHSGWSSEVPKETEWTASMPSAYLGFKRPVALGFGHPDAGVAVWASNGIGEPAFVVEATLRSGEDVVPRQWQREGQKAEERVKVAMLRAFESEIPGAGFNKNALTSLVPDDTEEATVQFAIGGLIADGRLRSEGQFYYQTGATA